MYAFYCGLCKCPEGRHSLTFLVHWFYLSVRGKIREPHAHHTRVYTCIFDTGLSLRTFEFYLVK